MEQFAKLLNQLYFTYSHLEKMAVLQQFIQQTADPDRGYALAIISGELSFSFFKSKMIRDLIQSRSDPYLFALSVDYVGDLSETVALLWPNNKLSETYHLPSLSELINKLSTLSKVDTQLYLAELLDHCTYAERWALIKLGTGELRIGVSARFIKQTLAKYGNKTIHDIERIWHGLQPPYQELLAWIEGTAELPDVSEQIFFHPVMLAHPLSDQDIVKINHQLFSVERKYDGIRVQLVANRKDKALFSRSGDNISSSFPDILETIHSAVVLDGELVIKQAHGIGSFNDLQQRLNRKIPSKKLISDSPGHIVLYDILEYEGKDLKHLPHLERRQKLIEWINTYQPNNMSLSELLHYPEHLPLAELREIVLKEGNLYVEGLMIKRKDSPYVPGRPAGLWYKWKVDPLVIDAVLMYAQRGHGKRSSYYSDYTFGLWENDILLPIGKAYSGFTDEELFKLDKWVRHHILQSFGPVRELEKILVVEVAFDSVNLSTRHKSGVALRFPRIKRIRWDKPANEADQLLTLKNMIKK